MKHYITKIALLSSALALGACSTISDVTGVKLPGAGETAAMESQLGSQLTQMEQSLAQQPQFAYQLNQDTYRAYTSAGKVAFVEAKVKGDVSKAYYKDGKLFAAVEKGEIYSFDAQGKLVEVVNSNGKVEKIADADAAKHAATWHAKAKKWQNMFGLTAAERNPSRVRTGADAKLNYLCIAKLQQVAGTKRVFRSSANRGNSTRLSADMRLNGNQYYVMDCQLQGDRVSSLSLHKK
ncbi:hypothetical protein KRX11_01510 [Pasteurellaceae bacterium TAE3-ERU1]|uniref:hypothetical protein n=1 Tax=Spirabiliibacterium mucosae TaxID=28156 RepID=UPI001AAD6A50|nr:hypothetical protein [Spirabiliibacterium mucosae]MBE2898652.1 hypothetical protein [Spirabiliibacterium mucosae]MBV7387324.1 hypothetical protein [Pasteurellaceae bacterium TAE3-ERU1]